MTDDAKVSRRGVYRDLSISPYGYKTPYGDIYKFPSQKKLDVYARDVDKEIERISKALDRLGIREHLPDEIVWLLYRRTYLALYRKIVE